MHIFHDYYYIILSIAKLTGDRTGRLYVRKGQVTDISTIDNNIPVAIYLYQDAIAYLPEFASLCMYHF